MNVKPWKIQKRLEAQAQILADHDHEPYTPVRENGITYLRPTRKALAMAASPRHPGLELMQEIEPRLK